MVFTNVNLNSSVVQELTKKIRINKSKSSIVYIVKEKNNNNQHKNTKQNENRKG